MEMLEHLGSEYSKEYRVKDVYEVWEGRNGVGSVQSFEV